MGKYLFTSLSHYFNRISINQQNWESKYNQKTMSPILFTVYDFVSNFKCLLIEM